MSVPKAVIFDLGKVLLEFDYHIAINRLAKRCQVSAGELAELLNQSPLLLEYEAGKISTNEFYHRVQKATGFRGERQEFSDLFGDIFTPIEPMVQLNAELRQRRVPTYVFSNTNELMAQFIRERFPFFAEFDGHILSYEHQSMKPEEKLYKVVESYSGHRGSDLFYLDDRPEHVATAVRRGWQAHIHESPSKSRAIITQAGLLN